MSNTTSSTPKSIITHPITSVAMSAAALIIAIATAVTVLLAPTTATEQPAAQPAQPAAAQKMVTKQVKSRDPQCVRYPICTAIGVHHPAA